MDTPNTDRSRLIERSLTVLIFVALLFALYQTVSVFLGIFTFAIIFAVPFSPLFEKFTAWLGNRRKLAAVIYAILFVALVAVPLILLISALADHAHRILATFGEIKNHNVPALPDWLSGLPFLGDRIASAWSALEAEPEKTLALYEPQMRAVLQKFLSAGGGILSTSLEIIVGIIFSSVLLYRGKASSAPLVAFFSKLLGPEQGSAVLDASQKAINGVAIGVMGTAVIEALAGWLGFRIAGIDIAGGLAAVLFLLAVVQLGPVLVLIPLILWMFSRGENGWGIFLIVWLVLLMVIDNVVKPLLIGKSGKMPVLILFLGVVGGMSVWGFTGMFKGAIVLAVMYTIFTNWVETPARSATS